MEEIQLVCMFYLEDIDINRHLCKTNLEPFTVIWEWLVYSYNPKVGNFVHLPESLFSMKSFYDPLALTATGKSRSCQFL